jgi:hypothetical protein
MRIGTLPVSCQPGGESFPMLRKIGAGCIIGWLPPLV